MAARVLTLTLNPSVDLSTTAEKVIPEHKIRCSTALLDAGGGGINVSRVAQELGALTLAIFPQGGNTGTVLAERLAERRIAAAPVMTRAPTRMSFNASESSTGHEYRFVLPGVPLDREELDECLERVISELPNSDVVVASGSLPPGAPDDTYAQLARRVRSAGSRMVLDTSGAALKRSLGEGLLFVKPSRRELSELVGEPLPDLRSLAAASLRVQRGGAAEVFVVSMGGEGAMLTSNQGQWLAVPPHVKAQSAVGAGDSFVAAMTLSLLRGERHDVALAWGSAAGAAALLAPGTDLSRRPDVERLMPQVRVSAVAEMSAELLGGGLH